VRFAGNRLRQLDVLVREEIPIADNEDHVARRDRHSRELEHSQQGPRTSIAESKRLADCAEAMIRRHRDECDRADGKQVRES
jgi:hypothetical protein